ncbi:MAG: ribonuclease P protein component, partial [Beijerinckiaceae bacterium]|nr:ribonuclease P protein component [Beijerinckiaceae bacterium]
MGAPGERSAPRPERLRHRAEFLNAAKGARFHAGAFSLQAIARRGVEAPPGPSGPSADAAVEMDLPGPARFGFTVTRKVGGSVERNRMRRRLREALRRAAPLEARAGFDYVIVARRQALEAGFDRLVSDLARAMRLVGERPERSRGPRR